MKNIFPLPIEVQNDLQRVNECLTNVLTVADSNIPPSQKLKIIKEWAIEALKKLPVDNYGIIHKYS